MNIKDRDFIEIDYIEPTNRNEDGDFEKKDLLESLKELDPNRPLVVIASWEEMEDECSFKFSLKKDWRPCLPNSEDAITVGYLISVIENYKSDDGKELGGIRVDLTECEEDPDYGYDIPFLIDEYSYVYSKEENIILASDILNTW